MKAITSRDNPLYKRLKALAGSTAQQRRSGHALLEGLHLASAYLDAAGQPETCVVTEGALRHEEARAIVARIEEKRVLTLPDALFGQLSSVVHGVGMLLFVERIEAQLPARVSTTCVVLDGVQDAGNVGSICAARRRRASKTCSARRGRLTRGRRRSCARAWARTSC